jgi:hypothetical protein
MKKIFILIICVCFFAAFTNAQSRKQKRNKKPATETVSQNTDTTVTPKTVVVTSAFKPTLREPVKINFSAASPSPDSTRPTLQYNVPEQNLFFVYQPATLQPLAAYIDSTIHWENKNFIKAGYGNYTTPYVEAGISLGDGQTSVINIHAKHISSDGQDLSEQYGKTDAEVIGIFNPNENIEWGGKVFFKNTNQYRYGFEPDTLKFNKSDLQQQFTTFGGEIGLRNKQINSYGVSYDPSIAINEFSDNRSGKESNFILNAPLSKSFGDIFAFNLGLNANLTNYTSDTAGTINNVLYTLSPAIQFKTPNVKIVAGISPSWDNDVFSMLPNFSAEAKLKDERFILQAGWIGYYNKTTYESLAGMNPWLEEPTFLLDTRITEAYAGFKGSTGSHFTYNAKISYLQFRNQPLFVNDTITGKSFNVVNEANMKDIRVHGEIGYTFQEKFSLLAGATFNQYYNLQTNAEPWGLLPTEINGSLRWAIFKDVLIKSDLFFWDGAQYRMQNLQPGKLSPAFDLNAGIEFPVLPKFNFWAQFNNIFNNKYERWDQYPVLGFNVLAGFVYSFSQNTTADKLSAAQ